MASPSPSFTFTPATLADRERLWRIKKTCLRQYVEETWGFWEDVSQRAHFDKNYELDEIRLIQTEGGLAGYLAAARTPEEIALHNIMISPAYQNRGLGTAVLRHLLAEARAQNLPVRLQVLRVNPARHLYERLGFTVYEETPTHFRLRWTP